MNKTLLTGRLTKDIEVKQYNGNNGAFTVGTFTVAVDTGYGDNKRTDYIECRLFGKPCEALGQYLLKGTMVNVIGALRVDTYQDKDNHTKKAVYVAVENVELLARPKTTQSETPQQKQEYNQYRQEKQEEYQREVERTYRPQQPTDDGFPF